MFFNYQYTIHEDDLRYYVENTCAYDSARNRGVDLDSILDRFDIDLEEKLYERVNEAIDDILDEFFDEAVWDVLDEIDDEEEDED